MNESDDFENVLLNTGEAETSDRYLKDMKLGEGTYAVVYKAKDILTDTIVAIKKIKLGQFQDGIDMSAIREVKFLQELQHPNIIRVSENNDNRSFLFQSSCHSTLIRRMSHSSFILPSSSFT